MLAFSSLIFFELLGLELSSDIFVIDYVLNSLSFFVYTVLGKNNRNLWGTFRNRGVTVKNINISMLLLATLVVISFAGVGFAIALRNVWLIILFIVLGFSVMGYGISLKKKKKK